MIIANILTYNNESTVNSTIESLQKHNIKIMVGDLGSTDSTKEILRKFNIDTYDCGRKTRCESRNWLKNSLDYEWSIMIEPYEVLVQLDNVFNKETIACLILNNSVVTKQTRIWNKSCKKDFIYPAYEHLDNTQFNLSKTIIKTNYFNDFDYNLEILQNWIKKEPHKSQAYYYLAMTYLTYGKYKEFLYNCDKFFFLSKESMSYTTMKYYFAMVNSYIENNANLALDAIRYCVKIKPYMAEFWCLFGDICYYNLKDYNKSIEFYSTAIQLGKQRDIKDEWFIEPQKYNDYPNKMIVSCKLILDGTKKFVAL